MKSCQRCGAKLDGVAWQVAMLDTLCHDCAQRMVACDHATGDQAQRYDADGVGFRVWRCDECGVEMFDPY